MEKRTKNTELEPFTELAQLQMQIWHHPPCHLCACLTPKGYPKSNDIPQTKMLDWLVLWHHKEFRTTSLFLDLICVQQKSARFVEQACVLLFGCVLCIFPVSASRKTPGKRVCDFTKGRPANPPCLAPPDFDKMRHSLVESVIRVIGACGPSDVVSV